MHQKTNEGCSALVTRMNLDADALYKVAEAAATSMIDIRRTAVPLDSLQGGLEAVVESLQQACNEAYQLVQTIRALAQRIERGEVTAHEVASILARPHYLNRSNYVLWEIQFGLLPPSPDTPFRRSLRSLCVPPSKGS